MNERLPHISDEELLDQLIVAENDKQAAETYAARLRLEAIQRGLGAFKPLYERDNEDMF